MMPELGIYAANILAAWGIGLIVLALVITISVREARRTRRRLQQLMDKAAHD